jgi:hypothetical protein
MPYCPEGLRFIDSGERVSLEIGQVRDGHVAGDLVEGVFNIVGYPTEGKHPFPSRTIKTQAFWIFTVRSAVGTTPEESVTRFTDRLEPIKTDVIFALVPSHPFGIPKNMQISFLWSVHSFFSLCLVVRFSELWTESLKPFIVTIQ